MQSRFVVSGKQHVWPTSGQGDVAVVEPVDPEEIARDTRQLIVPRRRATAWCIASLRRRSWGRRVRRSGGQPVVPRRRRVGQQPDHEPGIGTVGQEREPRAVTLSGAIRKDMRRGCGRGRQKLDVRRIIPSHNALALSPGAPVVLSCAARARVWGPGTT